MFLVEAFYSLFLAPFFSGILDSARCTTGSVGRIPGTNIPGRMKEGREKGL